MNETGTFFGNFELIKEISSGGMGSVYLAYTRGPYSFKRALILKLMKEEFANDPRDLQRFAREARIAARFAHRNVVPVYDFGSVRGRYYIAMEYVDGFNLIRLMNALLKERVLVSDVVAAFITAEVARGLNYLHTLTNDSYKPLGLVHRDVSPENILVSKEGEIKLTDFGLVKYSGAEDLTNAGKVRGKLSYMAPERVIGRKAKAASDQFSLGVVLHELLIGQRYFPTDLDRLEIQKRVTQEGIKPPMEFRKEVPTELNRIVKRATAMELVDRYPTVQHMEKELRAFIQKVEPDFHGEEILSRLVRALRLRSKSKQSLSIEDLAGAGIRIPDPTELDLKPDQRAARNKMKSRSIDRVKTQFKSWLDNTLPKTPKPENV